MRGPAPVRPGPVPVLAAERIGYVSVLELAAAAEERSGRGIKRCHRFRFSMRDSIVFLIEIFKKINATLGIIIRDFICLLLQTF